MLTEFVDYVDSFYGQNETNLSYDSMFDTDKQVDKVDIDYDYLHGITRL